MAHQHVNLRSVLLVLQELADSLVSDGAQRARLHQQFNRHLEEEESLLLHDMQGSGDELLNFQKIKAAKLRLEDACLADLAVIHGPGLHKTVRSIRALCDQDGMKVNETLDEETHESSRLLATDLKGVKSLSAKLSTFFPIIKWTRNYSIRKDLPGDLFAGCTVAFMTFPQTMGYAILAQLPPIYGLYSSFVPVLLYSMLGTSAEMSVGPAAMVALMIPSTLAPLAPVGSDLYILYANFLSFFSGIILFIAGILNGGFVVENVLSVPLLTGWIQGAAILIILSQMSGFLQIHVSSTANTLVTVLESISENAHTTNGWSVLVGGVCLFFLFGGRKLSEHRRFKFIQKFPLSLLVLVVVTTLSKVLDFHGNLKLNIIGTIPQGLPTPHFFKLDWELIQKSFKAAMIIAIIGFMEGISLAKKFAGLRKYRIDVSQELRALGLANMVGSCFKAFPVTGSVTRTTVNYQSGSRTVYSSIVNGLLVGAVLLFLSPLFYYTPKASLSSIVISAGLSLIDIHEMQFLWKIKAKLDLAQMLLIFLVTLFTGPEIGAVIAILVSVIQIIYRSTKPSCVTLGPVKGTTVYKTGFQFTKSMLKQGVLVVRMESGLFFYTTAWLKENLFTLENNASVPVKAIVLDASSMDFADATGVHGLMEIIEEYKKKNICIFFSNVSPKLMETLQLAGLPDKVGIDSFFGTTHEAVLVAQSLSYSERMRMSVAVN